MRRIIGLDVFEGKPIDGEYTLTVHELGNGHREAIVRQAVGWEHIHTLRQSEWDYLREKYGEKDDEEKREANLKRAARRAKTQVRRKVKAMGLDSLLTLTYRANQCDLALAKAHLKEFVRRMRRLVPGFAYVACFEQQKRGAWHVHMAIHRLPLKLSAANGVKVKAYPVILSVWRSVTGELGGAINEKRRKAWSRHSVSKMAAYLSKYITKAFEDGEAWSNRWSASSFTLPAPVRAVFRGASLAELIALAYAFAADGPTREVSTWLSRWGETFFLSTEGPPGPSKVTGT